MGTSLLRISFSTHQTVLGIGAKSAAERPEENNIVSTRADQ